MQVKDLGYSTPQLDSYLRKMTHVHVLSAHTYSYKDVQISIKPNPKPTIGSINIPRSFMELTGPEEQIQEFYNIFLLNYMTMGG